MEQVLENPIELFPGIWAKNCSDYIVCKDKTLGQKIVALVGYKSDSVYVVDEKLLPDGTPAYVKTALTTGAIDKSKYSVDGGYVNGPHLNMSVKQHNNAKWVLSAVSEDDKLKFTIGYRG